MNSFMSFWMNIRKELFFRLKNSMKKITVRWSLLKSNSNKRLKKLSPWKKIFLSRGRTLFLSLKSINIDLLLRLTLKSIKLIKIWWLKARIPLSQKWEWENLILPTAILLVKPYKKDFKFNGKTSKNKTNLMFNYRKKTLIWVNILNKVIFLKIQFNALKKMKSS